MNQDDYHDTYLKRTHFSISKVLLVKSFGHRHNEKFYQYILQKFNPCTIRFFRQSSNPVKHLS